MMTGRRSPVSSISLVDREDRGLGVERVEDGLDRERVGAAVEQAARLLLGLAQFVEAGVARAGIVDVRADRGGLRRRADRAGDEARRSGVLNSVAALARQPRGGHVHLVGQRAQVVVVLRDPVGTEGVGLDQVGAGVGYWRWISPITSGRVSTSRSLLPLRSLGWSFQSLAAEVGFRELAALDHRAHRAVEDDDALLEQLGRADGAGIGGSGRSWRQIVGNRAAAAWMQQCRRTRVIQCGKRAFDDL